MNLVGSPRSAPAGASTVRRRKSATAMTIDFHNDAIRNTYASRRAHDRWRRSMRAIVNPAGKRVADIGCGGGIYSRAWAELGAASVTGVDFSSRMVADARAACANIPEIDVVEGDAAATGLAAGSADIVFSRAVIHHLPDLAPVFIEARRILAPGGTIIVQDRTIEDVLQPASPEHLRGWFFDRYPRLLDIERERRPATDGVTGALAAAGFANIAVTTLAEPRRRYLSADEVREDLLARTGRSILHALDDDELADLTDHIAARIGDAFPIDEVDFWTIWTASAPAD